MSTQQEGGCRRGYSQRAGAGSVSMKIAVAALLAVVGCSNSYTTIQIENPDAGHEVDSMAPDTGHELDSAAPGQDADAGHELDSALTTPDAPPTHDAAAAPDGGNTCGGVVCGDGGYVIEMPQVCVDAGQGNELMCSGGGQVACNEHVPPCPTGWGCLSPRGQTTCP